MKDGPAPRAIHDRLAEQGPPRQVYYVMAESPCPYLAGRRERRHPYYGMFPQSV